MFVLQKPYNKLNLSKQLNGIQFHVIIASNLKSQVKMGIRYSGASFK